MISHSFREGIKRMTSFSTRKSSANSSSSASFSDFDFADSLFGGSSMPVEVDADLIANLVADVNCLQKCLAQLHSQLDTNRDVSEPRKSVEIRQGLNEANRVLRDIFRRYEFLRSEEVLSSAFSLIRSVQDFTSETGEAEQICLIQRHIGALQNAICDRVGEYITVEMEKSDLMTEILSAEQVDEVLMRLESGVDIAFGRAKVWSKYAKEIITFVQRRIELETSHVRQLEKLTQTTREAIQSEGFLPLQSVYLKHFKHEAELCNSVSETLKNLFEFKFVKPLEAKREEEGRRRKDLKDNWRRQTKLVKDTAAELKKCQRLVGEREFNYKRARETALKTEQITREQSRIDKQRKVEEDAMIKREMAIKDCQSLEERLEEHFADLKKLKAVTLREIRESMMLAEKTTQSCTAALFQQLAELWAPVSGNLQALSNDSRKYIPGSAYSQFVTSISFNNPTVTPRGNLSRRTASDDPLPKEDSLVVSTNDSASPYVHSIKSLPFFTPGTNYYLAESEVPTPTSQRSEVKSSANSSPRGSDASEAALTHNFERGRIPQKCCYCDAYVFLQIQQCSDCGIVMHKPCLKQLQLSCTEAKKEVQLERKNFLFGEPLENVVVEVNGSLIPPVLLQCVEELDKRGAKIKGLYRVPGVKSKVEKLCEDFEQISVDLTAVHPANIASFLKQYLRQLPEPLVTYQLYEDFIRLAKDFPLASADEFAKTDEISKLRQIVKLLPKPNYDTLKFLILHLKRLTWYQEDNQMNSANLGIVFGPTLLWRIDGAASLPNLSDANYQTRVVEILITHAYELFDTDSKLEWARFQRYRNSIDAEYQKDLRRNSQLSPESLSLPPPGDPDDSGFNSDQPDSRKKSATPDLLKSRPIMERSRSASTSTGDSFMPDAQLSEEEISYEPGESKLPNGRLAHSTPQTRPSRLDSHRLSIEQQNNQNQSESRRLSTGVDQPHPPLLTYFAKTLPQPQGPAALNSLLIYLDSPADNPTVAKKQSNIDRSESSRRVLRRTKTRGKSVEPTYPRRQSWPEVTQQPAELSILPDDQSGRGDEANLNSSAPQYVSVVKLEVTHS